MNKTIIIPSIDLIDGNVVRLSQGDYTKQQNYGLKPLAVLQNYADQGAKYLHIVDLTGAKNSNLRQKPLLENLIKKIKLPIQIGGGISHTNVIKELLNIGVKRVVIGSAAITNPDLVITWFKIFGGEKIVLALDINIDKDENKSIAMHGWQEKTNLRLETCVDFYLTYGLKHVLCTDIAKDGMLKGPNIPLYTNLQKNYPYINWQASGGVSTLKDIDNLKAIDISGIIIGKALLEKKFTLMEAITC